MVQKKEFLYKEINDFSDELEEYYKLNTIIKKDPHNITNRLGKKIKLKIDKEYIYLTKNKKEIISIPLDKLITWKKKKNYIEFYFINFNVGNISSISEENIIYDNDEDREFTLGFEIKDFKELNYYLYKFIGLYLLKNKLINKKQYLFWLA